MVATDRISMVSSHLQCDGSFRTFTVAINWSRMRRDRRQGFDARIRFPSQPMLRFFWLILTVSKSANPVLSITSFPSAAPKDGVTGANSNSRLGCISIRAVCINYYRQVSYGSKGGGLRGLQPPPDPGRCYSYESS